MHAGNCKITEAQHLTINHLTSTGSRPKDILAHLCQMDPTSLVTIQEVYNQRFIFKHSKHGDNSPIEALIKELEDPDNRGEWALNWTPGPQKQITQLYFAYNPAIKMAQTYPEVLLIDATY